MNILIVILAIIVIVLAVVLYNTKKKRKEESDAYDISIQRAEGANRLEVQKTNELKNEVKVQMEIIRDYREIVEAKNATLVNDVIFNIAGTTNEVATNIKVKTYKNKKGDLQLYPTIRRKVKGDWKEIPVIMKYKK